MQPTVKQTCSSESVLAATADYTSTPHLTWDVEVSKLGEVDVELDEQAR